MSVLSILKTCSDRMGVLVLSNISGIYLEGEKLYHFSCSENFYLYVIINKTTHLKKKKITNKDLLHSTGNSAQYSIIT